MQGMFPATTLPAASKRILSNYTSKLMQNREVTDNNQILINVAKFYQPCPSLNTVFTI
jgi:hypothetical protein